MNTAPADGLGILHGKLDGLPEAAALQLMHAAHPVCPYSRATRGNIEVSLALEPAASPAA